MYRIRENQLEVLIAHPGGPFFHHRDEDCWSIPKGEIEPSELPLDAAVREFKEEVGIEASGEFLELGSIRQKGGKEVRAWAFAGDWDESRPLQSNTFELEWPPGSGRRQRFPEVDRVVFLPIPHARKKLKAAQHPFLDRLATHLRNKQVLPIPTS